MNSCLGVRADDDGCASGQPAKGVGVRAGRSRRGAPVFEKVYGQARQHAGVLDAGSVQAGQRQGPEVPCRHAPRLRRPTVIAVTNALERGGMVANLAPDEPPGKRPEDSSSPCDAIAASSRRQGGGSRFVRRVRLHEPGSILMLCALRAHPPKATRLTVGSGAYVWRAMNSRTKSARSSIEVWGTRTRV
jgi:hypothetical protein